MPLPEYDPAKRITKNAARCRLCDTYLESTHVHDFRSCHCGAMSVDGGRAYVRRLWAGGPRQVIVDGETRTIDYDFDDIIEELSEYVPD